MKSSSEFKVIALPAIETKDEKKTSQPLHAQTEDEMEENPTRIAKMCPRYQKTLIPYASLLEIKDPQLSRNKM